MDTHSEMMLAARLCRRVWSGLWIRNIFTKLFKEGWHNYQITVWNGTQNFLWKMKIIHQKKKIHNSLALAASWEFIIILFLNSQQNCCCCLMLLGSQFENQNKSLMADFYVIFLSWTSDFFNFWHWQSGNKIFFLFKLF